VKTLIVDDDPVSRELLAMILKAYGIVDTAADGLEGLKAYNLALERGPYDLIMLDIMLPRMDGQQVLKAIRRIEQERGVVGPEQVKIVMISALGDFSNVSQAFASACTSYMTKPILPEKVQAELSRLGFRV
jgi:two-component system chemotaxis response regulator CheY